MTDPPSQRPHPVQGIVITVSSWIAAWGVYSLDNNVPVGVMIVVGLLALAPVFQYARSLAPQLIARAMWWQAALLGTLVLIDGHRPAAATAMIVGSLLAIAVAGSSGLWNRTDAFVPVAFRNTLLLSLILAIADFEALALYGSIFLEESYRYWRAVPFLAAALAMGVSIVGLYRLKVWGLVACIASNVVIAGCALGGVFDLPDVLVGGLVATAVAQLLLPLPLVRRMAARSASDVL